MRREVKEGERSLEDCFGCRDCIVFKGDVIGLDKMMKRSWELLGRRKLVWELEIGVENG